MFITQPLGNNSFSYDQRKALWSDCTLVVSSPCEIISLDEITLWDFVVFEEIDSCISRDKGRWSQTWVVWIGVMRSCTGLAHTYILHPEYDGRAKSDVPTSFLSHSPSEAMGRRLGWGSIIITDNHNHVLPYRLDLISHHNSQINTSDVKNYSPTQKNWHTEITSLPLPPWQRGWSQIREFSSEISLIHIDQHSDLGPNPNHLDLNFLHPPWQGRGTACGGGFNKESWPWNYIRDFAHLECNIGNFITPCISSWLISEMIQIRTEYTLHAESEKLKVNNLLPSSDSIIRNYVICDIDMDFRAPEMSISDVDKTMDQVRSLMDQADLITIATSPYFIDQKLALDLLHQLLWPRLAK